MKIIQINVSVNVGSTGRITEQIGNKIIANGGESLIAYGRHTSQSESRTIKIGNTIEQAHHVLITRFFDTHGSGSKHSTKQLIEEIELFEPNIIHLHNLHGYYLNIEVLFDFLSCYNKPVIWTLHDCWAFTGHCCYYSRVQCDKWKTECTRCPLTKMYPSSWGYDNSKNNFKRKKELFNKIEDLTLVPVSNWLEKEVSQSFLQGKETYTIHNGVDTQKFQYADPSDLVHKHNLKGKKIILGVASEWSAVKGLSDFLELSKGIDENTRIVLIGLSDNQRKNLPPNIITVPRLNDPKDLIQYYSMADVFVNPSIAESFGLVTVEAMSCGTPVLGYDVTATTELIEPGTGYLVERANVAGLLEKIEILFLNGKASYSKFCRQIVVDKYNIDNQFNKYIELYKSKINC